MNPVWYDNWNKREGYLLSIGFMILLLGPILDRIDIAFIGFLIMLITAPLQDHRFKRMKKLREDPMRCECGGNYVTPWELGFDAPADHLVCDNEHGNGRGIPCESWIVAPLDYSLLQTPNQTAEKE